MVIETWFSELVVLKIYKKSNMWQVFLQYGKLQDSDLNENVLRQSGLDKNFQENILAKDNFFKLLKKELPHGSLSQTLIISPWIHHAFSWWNRFLTIIFFIFLVWNLNSKNLFGQSPTDYPRACNNLVLVTSRN